MHACPLSRRCLRSVMETARHVAHGSRHCQRAVPCGRQRHTKDDAELHLAGVRQPRVSAKPSITAGTG
jgi:hypothetical protein